jgi:nucleoid DNA-binding protein
VTLIPVANRSNRAYFYQLRRLTLSGKGFFYSKGATRFGSVNRLLSSMAKLTKRDIVVAISNQTGMVQHEVFDVVQRTLDQITDSLARNVAVELRNFGVFQPRLTKPRVGRNPNQPGSSFVIPPRATVKFKAGKIMRQRVEKLSRELKEASERKSGNGQEPNGK